MINKIISARIPYREVLKKMAVTDRINGPKKSANLPKISKKPKYSLDSFFGTILPKYERDKDCTPP